MPFDEEERRRKDKYLLSQAGKDRRREMVESDGDIPEADRLLTKSEKLLASGDFQGAKNLAIRACQADPRRAESADYILAVSDTLVAGESRVVGDNQPDWYAVLRLARLTHNLDHVSTQYRRLALLLNRRDRRLPFADQAFELVSDAWHVLSDPSRKALYDRELQLSQLGQLRSQPYSNQNQQPYHVSNWETRVEEERPNPENQAAEPDRLNQAARSIEPRKSSFWTTCPYCLMLYEYPNAYEECTLRCQICRRAYHAVSIQSPPLTGEEQDVYFCSWTFFPLGFSGHPKPPAWSPVSPLFACPRKNEDQLRAPGSGKQSAPPPRLFNDDDDVYVEIPYSTSEENEDDDDNRDDEDMEVDVNWMNKKAKLDNGNESPFEGGERQQLVKTRSQNQNAGNLDNDRISSGSIRKESKDLGSSSKAAKPVKSSGRNHMLPGAKNMGRLDLNVVSNEVEEPRTARGRREGRGSGYKDTDNNIEGIGFFEGLDEFLNSLPILSVVADDEVKAT